KDAGDRVMLMLSCLVVFMFSIPVFMSLRPVHFFFASGQLNTYFVVLLATTAYAVWFVMKAARVERQVVERVSQVELNQPRVWSQASLALCIDVAIPADARNSWNAAI